MGLADGRANNAPAAKSDAAKLAARVAAAVVEDATFVAELRKALLGTPYALTLTRSTVSKKRAKAA